MIKQFAKAVFFLFLVILTILSWFLYLRYQLPVFTNYAMVIKSLLLIFMPLGLTLMTLIVLRSLLPEQHKHNTQWLKFLPLGKYAFHLVFLLFVANIALVYFVDQMTSNAQVGCYSAAQVLNSTQCFLLYNSGTGYKAYNPNGTTNRLQGNGSLNNHQGHVCQNPTSHAIYDTTDVFNNPANPLYVYRTIHRIGTANSWLTTAGTTSVSLCSTVTVTPLGTPETYSVRIDDVVTPTPSPTYTVQQLRTGITQHLSTLDSTYRFVDGKINTLDLSYIIRWLTP